VGAACPSTDLGFAPHTRKRRHMPACTCTHTPPPPPPPPQVSSDSLKWRLDGRHVARQCLLTRGVVPVLAALR
jgi:hypothetical protein